jgi:cell division protein FtsW (lipid II flippase)
MNWSHLRKNIQRKLGESNLQYDWWLILIVTALSLSGIAFLASASSIISTSRHSSEIYLLVRQVSFGLWIGFVCAFILAKTDYHKLYYFRKPLLLISFLFLIWVAVAEILHKFAGFEQAKVGFGSFYALSVNYATRWINTPFGFSFQPVELTKFALLIYISSYFFGYDEKNPTPITFISLKKHLYAIASSMVLVILQPDLGSALLLFAVSFGCLFVTKVPKKILVTILVFVTLFASLSILPTFNDSGQNTNYRTNRFRDYVTHWFYQDDPNAVKTNNHTDIAEQAIARGGIWGEGYGNSYFKKMSLIPEPHTDAIIAIVGEEMGFVGTLLFVALYLSFAIRGLRVSRRAPDLFGKSLAAGVVFWLSGQALLNLMSFLQITPTTGVPLPFVSYGSTSLLINLAALGILLNVSKQGVEPEIIKSPKQKYSLVAARKLKQT